MPEKTREELQAEIASLKMQLTARTEARVVPQHAKTTTKAVPTGKVAVPLSLLAPTTNSSTPEEIRAQIIALKSVIVSGVDSAAYGDKRTDFRSLVELRQILAGLEEELEEALGIGGRTRQIRMTTQWDKGL